MGGALRFFASGYSAAGEDDLLELEVGADGALRRLGGCRTGRSPSSLCRGADGVWYAGCEQADGAAVLRLCGLRVAAEFPVPGAGLCHVSAGQAGVFGCCYQSGDVFLLGYGGEVLWRRAPRAGRRPAHAHCSVMLPGGGAMAWADLGRDALYAMRLENGVPYGSALRKRLEPGDGPRQLLCLPGGRAAAVLENGNALLVLEGPGRGWRARQRLAATAAAGDNYPGGACLAPDGTLFLANRGADSIAAFRPGAQGYAPVGEWPAGGSWPRWTAFAGGFVLAACQKSGLITCHRWRGGQLTLCGALALHGASCVVQAEEQRRE